MSAMLKQQLGQLKCVGLGSSAPALIKPGWQQALKVNTPGHGTLVQLHSSPICSSFQPCRRRSGLSFVPTSTGSSEIQPVALTAQQAAIHELQQQMNPSVVAGLAAVAQGFGHLSRFLGKVVDGIRNSVAAVFPQIEGVTAQDVHVQLRSLSSNLKVLALVAPLARAASSESLTALYARTFERAAFGFAKMYLFCLFMRVLLSWFPGIDWNAQPWTFLRLITEPYLQIYRGILPPLFGQLDFTPLFGFLILQDVVEVMAPTFTMGLHDHDTSTRWTTSDVMCYFDGF